MPLKLSQLASKNKQTVTILFDDGDSLNVVVFPNRLTITLQDRIEAAQKAEDREAVFSTFLEIVDSWDVTDDDGNELPVTYQTLQQMGLPTIIAIQREINEAISPNDLTSTSSPDGSRARTSRK